MSSQPDSHGPGPMLRSMGIADLADLFMLTDLADQMASVEQLLTQWVKVDNPWLAEPSARVIRGGGKRLRPAITLAAAAAGGAEIGENVLRGAAAVELVHVGSLVHDDIIDGASTRRGVITVNAEEGVNHAILVGDFLLSTAGRLASTVNVEVSHALATAIVELCDGQSRETVSAFDPNRTLADYERSIEGKTAALLRASCRIGGYAAGLDPDVIDGLAAYGTAFGMAFQIIDDVLDIASSDEALGKPVGNDIRAGVYTMPLLFLLEDDGHAALRAHLTQGIDHASVGVIIDALDSSRAVQRALGVAEEYNRAATKAIMQLPASPVVDGLARLPHAYLEWAMRDKAAGRYTLSGA